VVVGQPSYVTAAAQALAETPLRVLKRYLKVRLLDELADELPQAFRDARFQFHGKALRGLEQDLPRWKKAVNEVDGALGEAVGRRTSPATSRPTTRPGRWLWSKI